MIKLDQLEVWFVTGSQHLYGEQILKNVADHASEIAGALDNSCHIPVKVIYKPVVTTSDEIYKVAKAANGSPNCIGLILWMHTFSPAKMWIQALDVLNVPIAHFHTQYNAGIPWSEIDMEFMNENQSAHGGREFGFIVSRMRKKRKVVVGHWQDEEARRQLGVWTRAAGGWFALRHARIARIGDNMRQVAVTEGDKVEAQIRMGFQVNGYGIGDVVRYVNDVSDPLLDRLLEEYGDRYQMAGEVAKSGSLREAARLEIGIRNFLEEGDFHGFTDTFEDLHGFRQLPGIASQRLMQEGYGFGAEGDWKTSALLYAVKVMDQGLEGGSSFMEDYTYDFNNDRSRVLGSHMLEICPSIAAGKPSCEVHPLSIGGKEDPARLVFDVAAGRAINVALIDMGNRYRFLVNEVNVVAPPEKLPHLPVARVLWEPLPNLQTAAATWIYGGGAHHTVFSKAISTEYIEDFAEMAGIELSIIDESTKIRSFKESLRWNEVYYHLFSK